MKYNKLFENPDTIMIDGEWVNYRMGKAITFGFINDEFVFYPSIDRGRILSHNQWGSRKKWDFPGRLWLDKKVISFWKYPPPTKFNEIIDLFGKNMNLKI